MYKANFLIVFYAGGSVDLLASGRPPCHGALLPAGPCPAQTFPLRLSALFSPNLAITGRVSFHLGWGAGRCKEAGGWPQEPSV